MRTGYPPLAVRLGENLFRVNTRVIAQREQVIQTQQLVDVVLQLPNVGWAIGKLQPPLAQRFRPRNRVLSVHSSLKPFWGFAGEDGKHSGNTMRSTLTDGAETSVSKEALAFSWPQPACNIVGHDFLSKLLILASYSNPLPRTHPEHRMSWAPLRVPCILV